MAIFSFNSALTGGIQATLSTWALSRVGVISQATTPVLKGTFFFGATTASLEYAATILSTKAKEDLPKDSLKQKGIDLIQSAFIIGSQYAVAQLGNRYFGMSIPHKFVHLLMASELIQSTTSKGKISQVSAGVMGVIYTTALSIFMEVPCAEQAFYCGVVSSSAYSLLGKVTDLANDPVHDRVKDLRYLFIYRIAVHGLLTAASLYLTGKVSKYLNIETSRAYLLGLMALSLPMTLTWGIFGHLFVDILPQLSGKQIAERIRDSQDPRVQAIQKQIEEMIKWGDKNVDQDLMKAYLKNDPIIKEYAPKLFNREVLAVFRRVIREWSQGVGGEDLIVHSAVALGGQAENLIPILEVVSVPLGVERNKAGAQFILDVVLDQASGPVLFAFKEMDPEFITLLVTKAVAAYAVDSRFAVQNLPPFFTAKTKEKIVVLRHQLLESPETRAHYVEVLKQLNTVVSTERGDEFFFFEGELSPEQNAALVKLKEIGAGELQSDFLKVCAKNATECIEVVERK